MTRVALTIAGSDSGGGAGIQADLKTFSALGVFGTSVITALTAQNTQGVQAIEAVSPDFIRAQMDSVFTDIRPNAVKIGMLADIPVIETVRAGLEAHDARNIVLDPVMVAESGDPLLKDHAVDAIVENLLPLADVITPNLHEAARLLRTGVAETEAEMQEQGRALLALGARRVLVKGGHGGGDEAIDFLMEGERVFRLPARRFRTENTHGTGCTLSSAIASALARGMNLRDAVRFAKTYITGAIRHADTLDIGAGAGPVHHFFGWWKEDNALKEESVYS